jgi:hypothetical protein
MNVPMRSLLLGYLALLWGGGVLGYGVTRGLDGSGSYGAGSVAGVALGLMLFVAGGWIVIRRARS